MYVGPSCILAGPLHVNDLLILDEGTSGHLRGPETTLAFCIKKKCHVQDCIRGILVLKDC